MMDIRAMITDVLAVAGRPLSVRGLTAALADRDPDDAMTREDLDVVLEALGGMLADGEIELLEDSDEGRVQVDQLGDPDLQLVRLA